MRVSQRADEKLGAIFLPSPGVSGVLVLQEFPTEEIGQSR